MPTVDLVGGIRFTHDRKTGTSYIGGKWNPAAAGDRVNGFMSYTLAETQSFTYDDSQWSYMLGVNYKPSDDTLIYAKYSRSYVSGGQVSVQTWKPEFAKSWEAGVKTTMLDGKLRANLAMFSVTYDNLQFAKAGAAIPAGACAFGLADPRRRLGFAGAGSRPRTGTDGGADPGPDAGRKPRLYRLQVHRHAQLGSADYRRPLRRSSLACAQQGLRRWVWSAAAVTAAQTALSACEVAQTPNFRQTLLPKITSNLWAQWESEPLFNSDARLSVRLDAQIKSSMRIDPNPDAPLALAGWANLETVPTTLILNGRIALSDIQMGPIKTTVALWGRNLTNDRHIQFTGGRWRRHISARPASRRPVRWVRI